MVGFVDLVATIGGRASLLQRHQKLAQVFSFGVFNVLNNLPG
jgi:hypothetical protein